MKYKKILILAVALSASIFSYAQQDSTWQEEVNYYLSVVAYERQNGITNFENYLSALYELALYYYEAERYDDAIEYSLEADYYFRQIPQIAGYHISLLQRLADSYFKIENYPQAISAQSDMIAYKEFIYYKNEGKTIDEYEVKLQHIVENYRILSVYAHRANDTAMRKKALLTACDLMEKNDLIDSCENADAIYFLLYNIYFDIHCENSDIDPLNKALDYLYKQYSVAERKYGSDSDIPHDKLHQIADNLHIKGDAYKTDSFDCKTALKIFKSCDSIYNILHDDTSEYYFQNALSTAQCLKMIGKNAEALTLLEELEPRLFFLGDTSAAIYFSVLNELSQQYLLHKYDEKASLILKKIAQISSKYDSDEIGYIYYNIGNLYNNLQKYDSAETYYLKALDFYKNNYSEDSTFGLIAPIMSLLGLYFIRNDTSKMDEIIEFYNNLSWSNPNANAQALFSTYKPFIEQSINMVTTYRNGINDTSDFLIKHIQLNEEYQKIGILRYNTIIENLAWYAFLLFRDGRVPNSIIQQKLIDNIISQYEMHHSRLAAIEREKIRRDSYLTLSREFIYSIASDSCDLNNLYRYTIFCKQPTLKTDIEFTKVALKQNNSALYDIQGIRNKIDVHNERIMRSDASQTGSLKWIEASYDSVRKELGECDIAIEYINYSDYRNFAADKQSTEKYIALVARKDWDKPKLVSLCTANEIEHLVSQSPDKIYGANYVSEEIIRLLFDSIAVYAKKGGRVYFSPDGILYNVAIENILTEEGITLGEKYNLIRCSSTRDIKKINETPQYASAVLYGGLNYGNDDMLVVENATRKGWKYLPGTLKEMSVIENILKRSKIQTETYSGDNGTEESFMQLSGKGTSIIHLATHGFFYTASSAQRENYFENLRHFKMPMENMYNQNTSGDILPLQRSGLMLSNSNKAWMMGDSTENEFDGVLLASEILNLNLFGTKLLVLSACETGLGDLSVEGIMGLQRAFKLAGVETIVMSLWEVDDKATALMMEQFYKNLMAGKSKRQAFSMAQQKVRKLYPDPHSWAAFIMLD